MRKLVILGISSLTALVLVGCGTDPRGPEPSSRIPSDVSPTDGPTRADFDDYSWRMFVALNWPTEDGRPRGETLGARPHAIRVWETWTDPTEILERKSGISLRVPETPRGRALNTDFFLQAGSGLPLIDAASNFLVDEMVIDPTLARFTLESGLTSTEGFRAWAETHATLSLPSGSIEVKASWRLFPPGTDPSILERYYVRDATISVSADDGASGEAFVIEDARVGLVGFHISQKTPTHPRWIWSTFEHVDLYAGDVPVLWPGQEGGLDSNRSPVLAATAEAATSFSWTDPRGGTPTAAGYVPPAIARSPNEIALPEEVNSSWRAVLPAPWSSYRLVVTQWTDPDGLARPTNADGVSIARNVALEAYLLGDQAVARQVPGFEVLTDCPEAGDGSTLEALDEQVELYEGYPATGRTADTWSSCLVCHQLALYRFGSGQEDVIGTDYSFIFRSVLPSVSCPVDS